MRFQVMDSQKVFVSIFCHNIQLQEANKETT